ncbi:MAG: transcriptional repressor LexA [Myxococcota bacterium]|jgi:repressor LexA|nr:transcriptional repressor LexA [Myxococcota bacterium]
MQGLTKRQQMVLAFISQSISDRGYPPTLREIGTHMGIRSTNGVNDHLRALERKGYLKREDMKSRALRPVGMDPVVADTSRSIELPLVGRVVPGAPVLREEHIVENIFVDRSMLGDAREAFAFRVRGDAMTLAGIQDGDIMILRKQMFADRDAIALVLVGDDATLRYYQPEKEHIRLMPANPAYAPILVRREDFGPTQILGVALGLMRRY